MNVTIKARINNTGKPYSQPKFTATAKQYRHAKRYLRKERVNGCISVIKAQIFWFKKFINPKEPSRFVKNMISGPKHWRFSDSCKAVSLQVEGIKIFDIDKLEGIQYGIDVFKNLSMREIVFLAYKMTSLAVIRGCANMCEHCFLSAKPARKSELSSLPFEDFKKITDGFNIVNNRINKVLRNKTGAYLTGSKQTFFPGYNSELAALFHDSDGINVIAKDADGNEHDFIELTEMMLEATGKRGLFDSAGWNPQNKRLQQRAEKYAQYFSQTGIEKKVEQINLSVNTFNPLYTKSYKLGFRAGQENDLTNPNILKGKLLYDTYIERISNMIVTLGIFNNAELLTTYSTRFEPNMEGMYFSDLKQILKDVQVRCNEILQERYAGEEYLERLNKINRKIDINLLSQDDRYNVCTYYGRYQSLYNSRNPNDTQKGNFLSEKIDDINLLTPEEYKDFLKRYTAYVDTNGQIYYSLGDHSVRPMGKQLIISTNGQKTPDVPNLEARDWCAS